MKKEALGSLFNDFLKEENLLAEAHAIAIKRAKAFKVETTVKEEHTTKTKMANT